MSLRATEPRAITKIALWRAIAPRSPMLACLLLFALLLVPAAHLSAAEQDRRYRLNLPAQNVAQALNQLSEQTDIQVLFPYDLAESLQSKAVRGHYTLERALELLLSETGLSATLSKSGVLTIAAAAPSPPPQTRPKSLWARFLGFMRGTDGSQTAFARSSDLSLEEIVVTAQKREQGINDVGITVNAFNASQLQAYGVRSAADLETLTPGLTVSNAQPTGVPVYTIRGVGFADFTTSASSTVGLYFDEVAVPYAVMSRGVLFDMARVEVLKGPQGDLYGRNTTAGQINFVSRKPTDAFEAGASLDYSRFDVLDMEGYLSGPLSDGVKGRLSFKRIHSSEGWQQSLSRPGDSLGERDEWALRAQLSLALDEDWHVLLRGQHIEDRSDNHAATPYDGTLVGFAAPLFLPGNGTVIFSEGDNRAADWPASFRPQRDNNQSGLSAKVTWTPANFSITSITAYDQFDRDERFDTSGVSFDDANTVNTTDLTVFSQELRISSDSLANLFWTAGLYYASDDLDEGYLFDFPDSFFSQSIGIAGVDTRYQQESDTQALFAHGEWRLNDTWRLTLGGRFTRERRKWRGCTYDTGDGTLAAAWNNNLIPDLLAGSGSPIPVTPAMANGCGIYNDIAGSQGFGEFAPFADTIKSHQWMWKTTLDFTPREGLLFYATVSHGFKSGGFNGAAAQTHSQLLPYGPEELTAYELGAKSTLLDGRLQLNAATFYYDYRDKQEPSTAVTPVGNIAGLTNVPESAVKGAELDMRWLLSAGLTLDLGVAYLDTEVSEYNAVDEAASVYPNVVTFDAAGEDLANAPPWQAGATLGYNWPLGAELEISAAMDISYKSAVDTELQAPISDYTLLNARLGVGQVDGRWRATLWGRNITNEAYWHSASTSNATYVRLNGMPATYGITLSYQYD